MRRSALADALGEEQTTGSPTVLEDGPSNAEDRLVTEFPLVLPRGYVAVRNIVSPIRRLSISSGPTKNGMSTRS